MIEINLNDKLKLKKSHPCGSNVFTVIRTGADIKIKCDKCDHIIMLDRQKLQKQIKEKL